MTSAVRTKEGDKAGSNQPPARHPVQFKLELTPNYLISYLENTGFRSTRYVSIPHPNESSILRLQDQLSQHDRYKNLNQRHLRYVRRFKSTNRRIATVGSSKPQPCPAQGCLFRRDTLHQFGHSLVTAVHLKRLTRWKDCERFVSRPLKQKINKDSTLCTYFQ